MTEATITSDPTDANRCRDCGAESRDLHICSACGRVLPLTEGSDYFSFFGLPKKLRLDEAALEKTFYALSRKLHPDYFMTAGDEQRQASIERSSMLNDAYRTLKDAVSRAQYLLALEGLKEAEKKAPPDLLEEVFELNLQVEELKMAKKMADAEEVAQARAALNQTLVGLQQRLDVLDQRLLAQFDEWDAAVSKAVGNEARQAILHRLSELLAHRSYLRNLVRDIAAEAASDR